MSIGKFITFEGCEGVGKSTQMRLLGEYFDKNNIPYIKTREPGGHPIAEKIRAIILDKDNLDMTYETESLLYAAARTQHINSVILPALKEGKIVLCDRFIHSSYAYQAFGRKLGMDFVKKINAYAIDKVSIDLCLFLDLSPKEAFIRKGGVDTMDRLELSGINFFNKVYDGFLQLLKTEKEMVRVKCESSKQTTHENIIKVLKEHNII